LYRRKRGGKKHTKRNYQYRYGTSYEELLDKEIQYSTEKKKGRKKERIKRKDSHVTMYLYRAEAKMRSRVALDEYRYYV